MFNPIPKVNSPQPICLTLPPIFTSTAVKNGFDNKEIRLWQTSLCSEKKVIFRGAVSHVKNKFWWKRNLVTAKECLWWNHILLVFHKLTHLVPLQLILLLPRKQCCQLQGNTIPKCKAPSGAYLTSTDTRAIPHTYVIRAINHIHDMGNELTHMISMAHYGNVIMGAIASQITSLAIVYSTVY